jgi:hypothetical protein
MKIPFTSQLQDVKDLDERNKLFAAMTKLQQRKEIAYDGILAVLAEQVAASYGAYWRDSLIRKFEDSHDSKDLQKNFCDIPAGASCELCQRGLVMLSRIRLGNSVDPNKYSGRQVSNAGVQDSFSEHVLLKMEYEFESNTHAHPYGTNSNRKLINTMCNVLANGTFRTSDRTDYIVLWEIDVSKIEERWSTIEVI